MTNGKAWTLTMAATIIASGIGTGAPQSVSFTPPPGSAGDTVDLVLALTASPEVTSTRTTRVIAGLFARYRYEDTTDNPVSAWSSTGALPLSQSTAALRPVRDEAGVLFYQGSSGTSGDFLATVDPPTALTSSAFLHHTASVVMSYDVLARTSFPAAVAMGTGTNATGPGLYVAHTGTGGPDLQFLTRSESGNVLSRNFTGGGNVGHHYFSIAYDPAGYVGRLNGGSELTGTMSRTPSVNPPVRQLNVGGYDGVTSDAWWRWRALYLFNVKLSNENRYAVETLANQGAPTTFINTNVSAWVRTGYTTTVIRDVEDPYGGVSGIQNTESTTTSQRYIYETVTIVDGTARFVACFKKAVGGRDYAAVYYTGTNKGVSVNLTTGVSASIDGGQGTVTSMGNDWWRVELVVTGPATGQVRLLSGTNSSCSSYLGDGRLSPFTFCPQPNVQ